MAVTSYDLRQRARDLRSMPLPPRGDPGSVHAWVECLRQVKALVADIADASAQRIEQERADEDLDLAAVEELDRWRADGDRQIPAQLRILVKRERVRQIRRGMMIAALKVGGAAVGLIGTVVGILVGLVAITGSP